MKLTFFDGLEPAHKDLIESELSGNEIEVIDSTIHEAITSVREDIEVAVVFVYSQVTKDVIQNLPNLKLIVTRSTGFDHIDLQTADTRNIPVCNVPYYGENTVAEHTFALLLALARHIPRAIQRVKTGSFTYDGLRGVDIKD
ncbi:hydroxyacid dehydrogenase, partial [candidate division WWE3 bacterium]|nr:hydroxyacid dehydrogenase [candidate division WWE3 bacterium]